MKMTKNSIKEIGIVNSTIHYIQDTCPFPLDDSWRISDGIKNGKKFEIDGGLYPHELDVFEDFETDKITLGLSISTCSRMNCKGDYVRYPKEYEMGKAYVLEEVLLENLRELKPQLKYFTIDIDDYGLEDDGDNGWEHWMGFVLIPIKSAFEAEEKQKEVDKMDYENIRKTMIEKTKNMEMTKENMEKIIAFENATYKNIGDGACTYEINEEKQTIKLISGPNDLDWEVVEEVYPMPFQGYIEKLCRCIAADIDDEMLKEVMRDFDNLELKYQNEVETLNKEDLVNKLLDKADIERMEEKGWIGPDKSLEDISGQFNDVFLETIWEDDIRPFWDAILNEAAKRYMESLPKEKTREEIIDKIVELCEEDTTWDVVEKVCEWLVENSKHIRQHFLDVGDVQVCVNGQIKRTGGIFLYSETDADDTIIDLNTWAYYEKKGQGDNFSKEELKELYEKLQDNE